MTLREIATFLDATKQRKRAPSDRAMRLARRAIAPLRWLSSPVLHGLEQLPDRRPLMFVANHMLYGVFEVPLLATELHRRTGIVLRGMGDHLHFQIPGWRSIASTFGVIDGTPENCGKLLATGECPLVFPGGAREAAKRRGEPYSLDWGNRFGFARLAARYGCTIIPVSGIGVDDAFEIWRDKDDFRARFGDFLDRYGVRTDIIWPLPRAWHPERMYFRFGAPIETSPADDPEQVSRRTHDAIEAGITWLLRERERDPDRDLGTRLRRGARRTLKLARSGARAAAVFAQPAAWRDVRPAAALAAARTLRRSRIGPHLSVPLHATLHAAKPAIADDARRLDWRGFDREIGALAAGLAELGVRAGDRVALVLPNGIEHVVAQQALLRLGATAVQIGYRLTAPEIAYIFEDAAPAALVYHADFAADVLRARERAGVPIRARCVVVGGATGDLAYSEVVRTARPSILAGLADPRASGLMIYTSGTTGRPKGATRSLRDGGYEPIVDFMRQLRMSPRDRHLVVCPLYHGGAFGLYSMMATLGASSVIMGHFDPEAVLATIDRERITSAFFVPTMLDRILALPAATLARYDTSSLRWIASGAAPLPTDTARRFQARFGKILWNFYGATETGVVTLAGPDDHEARPGTIGRVLRGNTLALLDEHGREVAPGEIGELYVKSSLLIGGYHGNPSATAASMRDGAFTVGDLARADADGYFYLESRKSDMIISGGVNIYPREIEDALCDHPDVHDCAVVGVADLEWGESAVAFVVPRAGSHYDPETLITHCRARLAGYKCPRRFEAVSELPRNETGKVLKRLLRDRITPMPRVAGSRM